MLKPFKQVLICFYFGEKRAVLKGSNRSRLWFKLAGISGEMEGENTMEKPPRVFRVNSKLGQVKLTGSWVSVAQQSGQQNNITLSF